MKKLYTIITTLAFLVLSNNIMAIDVKIVDFNLKESSSNNVLSIKYSGTSLDNPELSVVGKNIELKIPNAHINKKIIKKWAGIQVLATQLDRSTVKFVAQLPTPMNGKESAVNIFLKDGIIDVNFPLFEKNSRVPAVVATKDINQLKPPTKEETKEADKIDEAYLQKIEKETLKKEEDKIVVNKDKPVLTNHDVVTTRLSSTAKEEKIKDEKTNFSVMAYIGKFVAFMSVMILGFYGVLSLMKKGVLGKNKLSFLHSTKLVEVLNTTHVAPKKSLMMVRAHKQVFLISSTDQGIHLISEIKDLTGLIKTQEEEITGKNFDTEIIGAEKTGREFKLKNEDYVDYDGLDELLNEAPLEKKSVVDQVRLSDQIKNKIKNLKQIS